MSSSRSVLSPEARLLLASADPDPTRGSSERLSELLGPELDWRRLYRLIHRERAAGPMWEFLEPVRDRLDREFSRHLERTAAFEGLRQEQLLGKLAESVRALGAAGIAPLLLKGAALVLTRYGEIRQRPMGDIDLLVRPDEAERTRRVLLVSGWEPTADAYPEEMYDRHHHQPPLVDEQRTGIELEVHTGLLVPGHPFGFGPEDLRRRAREVECGGATALIPDPRDHLLYLCLHFAWSHALGSAGWRTFRDVALLTATGSIQWEEFLELSRDARADPAGYWTLRLAMELAGIEVPGRVLDSLAPSLPDVVLRRLSCHYALELFADAGGCPSMRLKQLMWVAGNEWGYRRDAIVASGRRVRPWEYSGDFEPMRMTGDPADAGAAKVRRHLWERHRWTDYLRRVLLTSES